MCVGGEMPELCVSCCVLPAARHWRRRAECECAARIDADLTAAFTLQDDALEQLAHTISSRVVGFAG